MPSDSNGAYSLPSGYLAVTGATIQATQHNPPLEDLASAMTERLPKSGVAPMTGPLKLADGTSTAPSLTLASNPTVGLYKRGTSLAMTGVVGAMPVGAVMDFGGITAPPGWLLCYGQSLLRADYPALYAAIGTAHGAVDGTHFNIPDCRGRVSYGYGGLTAGRLSTNINGDVLGAAGGSEGHTIAQANLPALTWPNTLGADVNDTRAWGTAGDVLYNRGSGGVWISPAPGGNLDFGARSVSVTTGSITASVSGSVTSGGSGTTLPTLSPGIVLLKIIFAGV